MQVEKLCKTKKRELLAWHIIAALRKFVEKNNIDMDEAAKESFLSSKRNFLSFRTKPMSDGSYFQINIDIRKDGRIGDISYREFSNDYYNKKSPIGFYSNIKSINQHYWWPNSVGLYEYQKKKNYYYEKEVNFIYDEFCKHLMNIDEEFARAYLTLFDLFEAKE